MNIDEIKKHLQVIPDISKEEKLQGTPYAYSYRLGHRQRAYYVIISSDNPKLIHFIHMAPKYIKFLLEKLDEK